MRRWSVLAAVTAALGGTAVGLLTRLRARRGELAPSDVVDYETGDGAPRDGTPEDRGRGGVYRFDVERLRASGELDPVVQYLTYIQSRRGESSHLLFVRYEDIDAMAGLEGQPLDDFLGRLDQLGVVVSNN